MPRRYSQCATLNVERVEDRICLDASYAMIPLPSITEIATGIVAQSNLITRFQHGQATANALIQGAAGNSDLGHVLVDTAIVGAVFGGGYLLATELEVSAAAQGLLNGSSASLGSDLGRLTIAVETAAEAAGAFYAVGVDYVTHGGKVIGQIQALGTGALEQAIYDATALSNATNDLLTKLGDTVEQAVGDFAKPVTPPQQFELPPPAEMLYAGGDGDSGGGGFVYIR